ncbi:MAG TPA: hypothetical protein VHO91_03545 [Rhodopila sp.]|nr:hypothetical protein [Rhodopila sp.]
MTTYVLRNYQSAAIAGDGQNDDILHLDGTIPAGAPTATFVGSDALIGVNDAGTLTQHGYGVINLMPGAAISTQTLAVYRANLSINERPGSSFTFNGVTNIVTGSTLTAAGYAGVSNYTVNGTMNIDGTSTVNMDYVKVNGTGTFHLTGEDALLRLGSTGPDTTVKLDGGMLSLTNGMSFLGTITDSAPSSSRIGPMSCVDVYNAMSAASETFNRTTGVLDLFNAQGSMVANLKFAGTGDLYAAPTTGLATNYISISAHQTAGALPVTFTS